MTISQLAVRHFGKKTVAILRKKNVQILAVTTLPDQNGNFANGTPGYMICNNGVGQVKNFSQVLEMAK